jgi:hypothetical protein
MTGTVKKYNLFFRTYRKRVDIKESVQVMWYLDGLTTNISRYIIGNKHKLVSTAMLDAIQMESTLKARYKRSPVEKK